MPSTISIADDLNTERADTALSAKQGVVLKGEIDGLSIPAKNRNYTNGKYLKSDGTIDNDATKFISDKIPATQGDVIYWRYGTNASMYMIEYNANGVKLNEWVANSTTGRTITLTRETTAYIRASFNSNNFASSYINKNGTRVWTASDGEDGGAISELMDGMDAIFEGGSVKRLIGGVTWSNDNVYINTNGEEATSQNYGHTNPIFVKAGKKIVAEVYSGTLASVIAVTDENGNFIRNAYTGKGGNIFSYEFTAEEDCYVVISCNCQTCHPYLVYVYDASSLSSESKGGDEIVFSGVFIGAGDTLAASPSFPVRKGDYLRICFPNGDWSTKSARESYNKLIWSYGDGTTWVSSCELAREGWVVPDYGYDVYVSERMSKNVTLGRLQYRAAQNLEVPFVVYRLSKERCKAYFADEMADTIGKVKALQTSACLTFAMISDLHYRDLEENYRPFAPFSPLGAIVSITELSKNIRFDNVICLGDVIDGRWGVGSAMLDACDQMEFFGRVGVPLLNCIGNHDDNRYFNQQGGDRRWTQGEIYAHLIQVNDERTSVGGAMNGCNYYRDVDRHKIRIIALMPIDFNGQYNYTSATQTWLTNTIASMPNDYKAIIITHVPPVAAHNWSGSGYTGGGAIETIITNNKSKVICLFEGHTHIDNVYVSPWPAVNICCQKVYNSQSGTNELGASAPEGSWWPVRAVGDYRENLWDAVVVNQTTGLLSCIRFGAGVDRHIHFAETTVSAGGTVTLTASAITATSWVVYESQASLMSIVDGAVTVDSSVESGTILTAIAVDDNGNREYWPIKIS